MILRSRQPASSPIPPRHRPRDINDVVARGGPVFAAPSDAKPNPEVDALDRLQVEGPVWKMKRPFRRKPDTSPAEISDPAEICIAH